MKFLGLVAVCATALLAMASPATARPDFRCSGTVKGKTYDEVVVPRGAACTLIDSTVKGNVRVLRNAYLQTVGTTVRGDIEGERSQTIFIDTGSKVSGSVESVDARQFFVFNSSIGEDIEPERTKEAVQICGNTVRRGNIEVRRSGPDPGTLASHPGTDILIGDPLTEGCRGKRGEARRHQGGPQLHGHRVRDPRQHGAARQPRGAPQQRAGAEDHRREHRRRSPRLPQQQRDRRDRQHALGFAQRSVRLS